MSKSTQEQLAQVREQIIELFEVFGPAKPKERHADYCRPDSAEGCTCWRRTMRLNAHSMGLDSCN